MRWFVYSVLLVMSVMLGIACTAVSPNDCFPNTSAGFGGGGPIPIGNGVGATTGDFGAPPSPHPQGAGDKPNPCETPPAQSVGTGGDSSAAPSLPPCDSTEGSATSPCLLPPLPLCDSDGGVGSATSPCIMPPQSSCYAKCDADYEKAAVVCGKIADAGQRKTCQDSAYANYKSCRQNCASAQKTCLDMHDACQDIGGNCTKAYPGCDTYGSSACKSCFDACEKGNPYPSKCKCKSCGFTE